MTSPHRLIESAVVVPYLVAWGGFTLMGTGVCMDDPFARQVGALVALVAGLVFFVFWKVCDE